MSLPINVKISIAINREELEDRNVRKLARYAIKQGHILAFRFHRSYDTNFYQLSPPRMAKQLKEMRQLFSDKLQYDLKYVYIPLSDDALTDQTKAIEDAGFTVFGASMDCPKIYWNNHDQMQPSQFVKGICEAAAKGLGPIVVFSKHGRNLIDDMEDVFYLAKQHRMSLTSLDQCLA